MKANFGPEREELRADEQAHWITQGSQVLFLHGFSLIEAELIQHETHFITQSRDFFYAQRLAKRSIPKIHVLPLKTWYPF